MIRLNTALGLALMFTTAVAACSAPEIPDHKNEPELVPGSSRAPGASASPAGADEGDGTDASVLADASAVVDGDAGTSPAPAPASCAGTADYASCYACCDAPTAGALGKADDAFEACSCGAAGACASVCATTFCAGQKGSAACNTCLTNTCDTAAAAACTTAACQAGKQCLKNDCDGKP